MVRSAAFHRLFMAPAVATSRNRHALFPNAEMLLLWLDRPIARTENSVAL
jgi:hypothetical protein